MDESDNTSTKPKRRKAIPAKISYVNVNRASKGYRDKYKRDVEKAVKEFAEQIGKKNGEEFTPAEWKRFFKTILIPLDKDSEIHMIDLFKDNRPELNQLLVLHNTKAGENIAEVYFKRYMKDSPTKWYDLDDFKQMANEGLVIAAEKFKPEKGNKFITFATWWVLNRVRKPNQERGAMVNHVSLDSPISNQDSENPTTFGELLVPSELSPDLENSNFVENIDPRETMDKQRTEENHTLYSTIKGFKGNPFDNIDKNKAKEMLGYLLSIVDRSENSYDNRQIYLYLFKKVFNKYSNLLQEDISAESRDKLTTYISEAAKSKSELLSRLNMDEKQYELTCKKLTRTGYDGI